MVKHFILFVFFGEIFADCEISVCGTFLGGFVVTFDLVFNVHWNNTYLLSRFL